MKTSALRFIALAALLVFGRALADDAAHVIKFSKPGAPRTVRIEVPMADLKVTGADVDHVSVRSGDPAVQPSGRPRADGLRVIASGTAYDLTEKDNVVTLSQDQSVLPGGQSDFEVVVPRDAKVIVQVEINGAVKVSDVNGDVVVSNLNGEVELANLGGSVSADTMNGRITARYGTLVTEKVHAFSTMNGAIELSVPADAKATFKLRAQNGTVVTDLDEKVFVTRKESGAVPTPGHPVADIAPPAPPAEPAALAPEAPSPEAKPTAKLRVAKIARPTKAPRPPTFPSFGGQAVTGELNGGGVVLQATTMNGEIKILRAK